MTGTNDGGYISELSGEITSGLGGLPEAFRNRQRHYLRGAQNPDGGFGGRKGGSDLYYTHFALWALSVLDVPAGDEVWHRAAYFLSDPPQPDDIPDVLSLVHGGLILSQRGHDVQCDASREQVQRLAGGGCCSGVPDSLYDAFLGGLTAGLLGLELPPRKRLLRFVEARRCRDGGFADLNDGEKGGINPTAAGVALLEIYDSLDEPIVSEVAGFVTAAQRPDGGFPAHSDAPCADLMSTFTALVALRDLGKMSAADLAGAARFARELRAPDGGFRGARMHDVPDVEYTFYGLGVLGLLKAHATRAREHTGQMASGGSCCR